MKIRNVLGILLCMAFAFAVIQDYIAMQEKTINVLPAYTIYLEGENAVAGEMIIVNGNITYNGSTAKQRTVLFDILADDNIYVGYDDTNLQDVNYPEIIFTDEEKMTESASGANYGYEYPYFAYSCTNKTVDATHEYDYVSCSSSCPFNPNELKNIYFAFETNELTSATQFTTRVLLK